MTAALFDPDAIVRAVRAAANLAPRCDNRDLATNLADCRKVAIVAAPITPINADDEAAIEERAGMASGSVPPAFLDTWSRLNCQKPEGVSEAEWRLALDDGGLFLDAWGNEAADIGWTPGELFDLPAGLVWRLAGQRVLGVGSYRILFEGGHRSKDAAETKNRGDTRLTHGNSKGNSTS